MEWLICAVGAITISWLGLMLSTVLKNQGFIVEKLNEIEKKLK